MKMIKPVIFVPPFPLDKLKIRIHFYDHGKIRAFVATCSSFMNGSRLFVTSHVIKLLSGHNSKNSSSTYYTLAFPQQASVAFSIYQCT